MPEAVPKDGLFFWSLLIYLLIVAYFNMLSWEMDNNFVGDINTSVVLLLLNSAMLLLFYFEINIVYQSLVKYLLH